MKLCIVEDNQPLLANLQLLLGGEPGCTVVGAYSSAEEALAADPWKRCDLLLVDIDLPGRCGVELIREVHRSYPELQALVHTISEDREVVFSAIKAGAMGYLLKGGSPRELIESLRSLHAGGAPMSPRIARKFLLELQANAVHPDPSGLSPREVDVLKSIAQGMTYKEIADALGRSPHTVHAHIKAAYEKLQAANRAGALRKARSLGLI